MARSRLYVFRQSPDDSVTIAVPAEWGRQLANGWGWEVAFYAMQGSEQRVVLDANWWSATTIVVEQHAAVGALAS